MGASCLQGQQIEGKWQGPPVGHKISFRNIPNIKTVWWDKHYGWMGEGLGKSHVCKPLSPSWAIICLEVVCWRSQVPVGPSVLAGDPAQSPLEHKIQDGPGPGGP